MSVSKGANCKTERGTQTHWRHGRLQHFHHGLLLQSWSRTIATTCAHFTVLGRLGRDFTLRGDNPPFEALIFLHVFRQRLCQAIMVCKEGIIALLKGDQFSASSDEFRGQIGVTAKIIIKIRNTERKAGDRGPYSFLLSG